jgi:hypothetical protein
MKRELMLQVKFSTGIITAKVVFIARIAMLRDSSAFFTWHSGRITALVIERLEGKPLTRR